ncbi:putative cell division control protein [Vibrio phage 501E54-1]|nr:putative cell division control protein [Vibrio phage 501E54-1]
MDQETKDHLHKQLIQLGDMMGDGLHLEPDGKWISRDYKKILKALGMLPKHPRKNNSEAINEAMERRVTEVVCKKCEGKLKQTRKGSKRAVCEDCDSKYQLLK